MPRRGDIIRLDFDPSAGHEQQGTRPAMVLSPEAFNRFGLALACPVTRGGALARGRAWAVPLAGVGLVTDGVVLSNQVRTVDWMARRAQFVEVVQAEITADALARVATLIEWHERGGRGAAHRRLTASATWSTKRPTRRPAAAASAAGWPALPASPPCGA